MGEDGKIFSEGQVDKIYTDMLRPLKVKISEILLYDTKAAMTFLQKYNEILECKDDKQVLSMITDLEFEIESYEKSIGDKKSFEDKSEAIIQQIKDMKTDGDKLSVEDFEEEFLRLKQTYKSTFKKYSLRERDSIEQQLYELYGRVMVRRTREGAIDEVEIPKEDEAGLRIFLNNEIGKLSENANPQVQNAIERIKFKLMDEETAFQGDEIWKLLSFAQNQESVEVTQQTSDAQPVQTTALAVVKQRKEGIFSRIKKIFQKKPELPELPQLPLQVEDIGKITIDWLSQYVPKSMLEEIENQRLANEGKNPEKRYVPYPQTAIYNFFAGKLNIYGVKVKYERRVDIDESHWGYEYEYEYKFTDSYENTQTLITLNDDIESLYSEMILLSEYLDGEKKRKILIMSYDAKKIGLTIINYAIFLDKLLKTNLTSKLLNDYMEIIKKYAPTYDFLTEETFVNNSELFRQLFNNYNHMKKECEKTVDALMGSEQEARRKFYKKTAFKDSIRATGDSQPEISQQVSDLNKGTDIEQSQRGEAK